jgi:hypothetical protein
LTIVGGQPRTPIVASIVYGTSSQKGLSSGFGHKNHPYAFQIRNSCLVVNHACGCMCYPMLITHHFSTFCKTRAARHMGRIIPISMEKFQLIYSKAAHTPRKGDDALCCSHDPRGVNVGGGVKWQRKCCGGSRAFTGMSLHRRLATRRATAHGRVPAAST